MVRGADQPFVEEIAPFAKVYHRRRSRRHDPPDQRGARPRLVAHPRIKASSWTPRRFKDEDFFRRIWLAAMESDARRSLREKLGDGVLNLMSDMANWGHRKYAREVDVFTIDHTHELYANEHQLRPARPTSPASTKAGSPSSTCSPMEVLRHHGEILIPTSRSAANKAATSSP